MFGERYCEGQAWVIDYVRLTNSCCINLPLGVVLFRFFDANAFYVFQSGTHRTRRGINKLRYELDDYDEKLYYSETDVERPASIIGFALGLNGGIKNSFYFGTLYLDAGLNYSLIAIKSPNMNDVPSNYSNIFFGINIGIRKDFY